MMIINDDDDDDNDDEVSTNRKLAYTQFKDQHDLLRKEVNQKEVETPREKLLVIFCSLIS